MTKCCYAGKIVTLDDGQEYLLVRSVAEGDNIYYLAVKMFKDEIIDDLIDGLVIFKYISDGKNESLCLIKNDENRELITRLKNIVANEKHMINFS